MLRIPSPTHHGRRVRSWMPNPQPAPVGPVVLSAMYDPVTLWLRVYFDRPIDITAIDPSKITVNDAKVNHHTYVASGQAQMQGGQGFQIGLSESGEATGTEMLFTAAPGNGIISRDDGTQWPGERDYPLVSP